MFNRTNLIIGAIYALSEINLTHNPNTGYGLYAQNLQGP